MKIVYKVLFMKVTRVNRLSKELYIKDKIKTNVFFDNTFIVNE